MKKHVYKTKWLTYPQMCDKAAICWHCDKTWKECSFAICDPKLYNKKTKKTKVVVECNKYIEQIFNKDDDDNIIEIDTDIHNDIYHLIWKFCDRYCQGRHNITQSSDGWDYMIHELTSGFYYALTHRSEFNKIKKLGRNIREGEKQ